MKNRLFLLSVALFASLLLSAQNKNEKDMDRFIDDLMARMTLREKLGQLNQLPGDDISTGAPLESNIGRQASQGLVGSVLNVQGVDKIRALQRVAVEESRLGIPILVGLDVIHGHETLFPVPLGVASTWDMEGIRQSAHIAATEAGANGIAWTFSPMVDISLDARWGRQAEGAGEDPFLGSRVAEAMVQGYQGDLFTNPALSPKQRAASKDAILACVKHFALYGAAEAGVDYNTVDMSRQRMYNQYFAPYRAAVEAGAGSVMSSFNIVDGLPATANRWLLTDVLRRQWGFQGFVVTDYASIAEMKMHGIGDLPKASALALKAGTDMDMVACGFIGTLEQALAEGRVTQDEIDAACRRILVAKYKLGLFADPYKYCDAERSRALTYCDEHRRVARRLTAESFVLLRNEGNLLPLKAEGTVALIGPMADNREDIAGTWSFSANPSKYRTLREAMQERLASKGRLLCTQGCNLVEDARTQETLSKGHGLKPVPRVDEAAAREEALSLARQADVIVCAMGESAWMSGEGTSRTDLEIPAPQRRLLEALCQLGKPVVLLNFAGRATVLQWESQHVPAIMNVWFGSEAADALCDVLFGDVSPSGRLTVSMPRTVGQLPLYYNRLPSGRPVADNSSYGVFSGHYLDAQNSPLYPFGYGLTYSTVVYGKPSLDKAVATAPLSASSSSASASAASAAGSPSSSATVPAASAAGSSSSSASAPSDVLSTLSVEVTNTGNYDVDEVVQLYIHDLEASLSRPLIELKGFERVHLKAGESRIVRFPIRPDMLRFWNYDLQHVLEPGAFDIMVGPNCKQTQSLRFTLE